MELQETKRKVSDLNSEQFLHYSQINMSSVQSPLSVRSKPNARKCIHKYVETESLDLNTRIINERRLPRLPALTLNASLSPQRSRKVIVNKYKTSLQTNDNSQEKFQRNKLLSPQPTSKNDRFPKQTQFLQQTLRKQDLSLHFQNQLLLQAQQEALNKSALSDFEADLDSQVVLGQFQPTFIPSRYAEIYNIQNQQRLEAPYMRSSLQLTKAKPRNTNGQQNISEFLKQYKIHKFLVHKLQEKKEAEERYIRSHLEDAIVMNRMHIMKNRNNLPLNTDVVRSKESKRSKQSGTVLYNSFGGALSDFEKKFRSPTQHSTKFLPDLTASINSDLECVVSSKTKEIKEINFKELLHEDKLEQSPSEHHEHETLPAIDMQLKLVESIASTLDQEISSPASSTR